MQLNYSYGIEEARYFEFPMVRSSPICRDSPGIRVFDLKPEATATLYRVEESIPTRPWSRVTWVSAPGPDLGPLDRNAKDQQAMGNN
jgi:hypothetical protein